MRSKRKYSARSFNEFKRMVSYVFNKTMCLFGRITCVLASLASIAFFYAGDYTTAILCFIAAGVYLNLVYNLEKEIEDYLK